MATTVLTGGRVVDPATAADLVADVTVVDGLVATVAPPGTAPPADAAIIDCTGLIVTPGLIDLHTHVVPGLGDFCVHPDRAGVTSGVPTVIDAGTSGLATFGIARARTEAPDVATRVRFLIDPCTLYLATKDFLPHRLHLADDLRNLDLDAAAAALEEHGDVVVGLKARACTVDGHDGSPFLDGALQIAGPRPVMVHLGAFPYTPSLGTEATLSRLRGGDIVTHAFRGHSGVIRDGALLPALTDARDRGVVLDVGHSGADFRFAAARALLDLGVLPDTVSSDLNRFNEDGPVHSLIEVMSKVLALGVDLTDVIAMATITPARVLHLDDELGSLAVGRTADITVLRLADGPAALSDGFETVTADRRLEPVGCLRAGAWHAALDHAVAPLPHAA